MYNMQTLVQKTAQRFILPGILATLTLGLAAPMISAAPAHTNTPATTQKCAATDVQCVIQAGDKLIQDRQTDLTTLSTKLSTAQTKKEITSDQAADITSAITENQNDLTTLKTKLDAETTAKAAREDDKSIFTSLRIYAVVLPREYKRLHVGVEVVLRDKFEDLKPHVENLVDAVPAADKTQATNLISDYKTSLAAAETQIDNVQALLPQLTVNNYNNNRATYTSNLKQLDSDEITIHTDLHQTSSDLHQLAQLTKKK